MNHPLVELTSARRHCGFVVCLFAGATAAVALSGCAAGGAGALKPLLDSISVTQAAEGTPNGFSFTPAAPTAPAAPVKSLIGSEIDGLLKKHPITNSQRPETWPRVAITVVSATAGVFNTVALGSNATIKADDCVVYDIKVWTSAKESKAYDGLKLCYGDLYKRLQGIALYQVPTWGRRRFWPDERNTGSVRNAGPVPPADHFPTDPQVQDVWLDAFKNTVPFVAGPLQVLGLNWNDVTDKRVWFVSVPAKAGVADGGLRPKG